MSDTDNIPSENDFEDGFLGASVQEGIDDRAFGPQFPILQWVNGNKKNKKQGGISYTGGFFISADQGISAEALEAAGFKPSSLVTNDGTEVPGFECASLVLSPIRYRRCWQVQADGQLARRFGWDEYDAAQEEGKPRGVAHVLCAVQGLEEPVLVSFRGMTARRVMGQGKERGIIPLYGQKIVAQAKRLAKKAHKDINFPLCAFRLEVGPQMDGKEPVFSDVGSTQKNVVTYPEWRDEPQAEVDTALLNRLFVGSEKFALYQDWYKEADEWVAAWNTEALQGFRSRRGGKAGAEASEADGTPSDNQVVF